MDLNGVGVWSTALRYGDHAEGAEAAAELEELGYSALWVPDFGGPVVQDVARLLAATRSVTVATGILNLWMHDPADVAARIAELGPARERFLVGIGVSHAPLIDTADEKRYRRPLAAMETFLDGLDAAPVPVPAGQRVLAALGPKMLALAAGRTRGAHPYLVSPEHTRQAREVLGAGPLLVPEQTVVLAADRDAARALGADWVKGYLTLPNYRNNVLRLGFTEEQVETVDDHLFDALIAWGDEDAVRRRVEEHLAAGADHVCIQVLDADPNALTRDGWRRLAPALTALAR
jgi:probable F420-dependent oxidoreductase